MKTIEDLNKKLEELGIEPLDMRPKIILFVVINDYGSDIGNELWGVFETEEEAKNAAENANLCRYKIERECVKISKDYIVSVLDV
jgi:hypothetical protein